MLALLAIFSGLVVYLRMASTAPRIGHRPMYLIVIAFEWALFAFSLWHSDIAFTGYIAQVLRDPRSLLWDIPVALILSAVLVLISPVIVRILGQTGWVSTQGMLPHDRVETALWMVMAISAGICEETVFRGYLQRQICGWTGHIVIGIVGQGAIFGLCHAYQGWKNVALIVVWGCVFGGCAWWRKGLRANMIAHAALDIVSVF
ncbi:MAG TPA: CPBP family intramembrane glutamic endopeptidase [Terriglobales bacterium]